ncbi:hypothetical protein LMG19083_03917 [Ralstonia psammae]|uniref:DUF4123 domain-containing protein n=1 Tax=Ralstonia psammae TaxID=3058598 RepID=A0ABN9JA12_9RALS|nr:DUF4123 domain-containing protein [Ralstonia sp. LMG 19083]CAJ0803623.1 hypothetical protein LMG19083_03917 [Ralstonia sp. LMG 19083]
MYFAVDPLNVVDVTDKLVKLIAFNPEANWTAVVDSAFDYGRGKCDYPGSPEALYACDELDAMQEVSPLLVPLVTGKPALLDEQLSGLAKHCSGRPMLSVVASPKNAEELKPNWQKCARVTTDDGQKLLLRFADTRVLPVLPEVLHPASWAALTHELSQWWYVDRAGTIAHVPVATVDTAPKFPFAIGKREFKKLLEQGEPDSVIDAISRQLAEILPPSNKAAFFERIEIVCEFARAREIDAFPDVVALGIFDTLNGHQSLSNPKLLNLVAERGWKRGEMAAALTKLFD